MSEAFGVACVTGDVSPGLDNLAAPLAADKERGWEPSFAQEHPS